MRRALGPLALWLALQPAAARAENPFVRLTTTLGSFDVELCQEVSAVCAGDAPNTVANFLSYVDGDHYPSDTIIDKHAPAPNFIQGGALHAGHDEQGDFIDFLPTFGFVAREIDPNLLNVRGSMAMIYEPGIDGSKNWWFINLADNPSLDGGYAVFGQVVAGMDVVDAIGAVPSDNEYLFHNLPLVDYPGEPTSVVPYLVYVTSTERVPEPDLAAALLAAVAALATLARRAYPARP
jgi:peptidyl-prolyl cis-trans isomerase A (cyclophilin A)